MQVHLSLLALLFSTLLLLSPPAFSAGGSAPRMPGGVFRLSNINQADIALLADVARARHDVDGSGLKVGVISTSYNYLGGEDYDVERGVLPDNVYVLYDDSENDDEGRAMAQLVHSVAPGAELYVSTPFPYRNPLEITPQTSLADQETFAQRIRELVDLGCDVIVDDMYDPVEPWFQDGPVSLAIDEAVENGVAYFTAAGNDSNVSYQSEVSLVEAPSHLVDHWNDPSSGTPAEFAQALSNPDLSFHDFSEGEEVDVLQRIFISGFSDEAYFFVQWDQPWGANNSDVEIWFFDENKKPIGKAAEAPGYPLGYTAFAGAPARPGFPPLPALSNSFYIAFTHNANGFDGVHGKEVPGFFKWIAVLNGTGTINGDPQNVTVDPPNGFQGSSTTWGHGNSRLGASVGASSYWNTPAYNRGDPLLTDFSSFGGTPIFFDTAGNRLPEPELRQQPKFTAPQVGNTSFFDGIDPDLDQLKNFSGTSAAAPNSAAVAALMLQLDPDLTPSEIYQILAETSVKIPAPQYHPSNSVNDQFNYATGVGLIRADHALARVADLSIKGMVFQDFARDGIKSGGDLPLSGYSVFLDSNQNGLRDVAPPVGSSHEFVSFQSPGPIVVDDAELVQNPNVWPADAPKTEDRGQPFGDPTLNWPRKAFSPIQVSEMPGTVTDLELVYEIRANTGLTSSTAYPFFLTLISPLGIRVPIVGTGVTGASFQNPQANPNIADNWLSDTQTYTRTISMGDSADEQRSLVDLAAFKDLPAEGVWYLEVMNPDPSRTYTLESWSLSLKTGEQRVTTDHEGRYEFPGSLLSFSSVVGLYTPMIELRKNQFITKDKTVYIGIRKRSQMVNIGVSSTRTEAEVVKTGKVDWRGKFKVRGRVGSGQSVEVSTEGVYCRTYRNGRFVCRGKNLEPGLTVAITLKQSGSIGNSGSTGGSPVNGGEVVGRGQVDHKGRVMIKGRVDRGLSVESSHEDVLCRTFAGGYFNCRGKHLEPGLEVVVVLQP